MKSISKFFDFFTGDLDQPLIKICVRFIATNILLMFILAIPMLYIGTFLVSTVQGEEVGLGGLFFPFLTFMYITPLLAIVSAVRIFRTSESNSRKLGIVIILLLPLVAPLAFLAYDFLIGFVLLKLIP